MPKLATKGPLVVFYKLWARKSGESFYVSLVDGKEVTFDKLEVARTYAAQNGFEGIRTRPWRGAETLTPEQPHDR